MGEGYLKIVFGVLPELPSGVCLIERHARDDNIVNAMLVHEGLDVKLMLTALGIDDWQSRVACHVGLNTFGLRQLSVLFDFVFEAVADLGRVVSQKAQLAEKIDVRLVTS